MNFNNRQDETTLMKSHYQTTLLPLEFWASLFVLDCPQSITKRGKLFPVFIHHNQARRGKKGCMFSNQFRDKTESL